MPDDLVVIGSINVDHTVGLTRFPRPGETLLAESHSVSAGGKGANQAAAAALAGANVEMVAVVGDDEAGADALAGLRAFGVGTDAVVTTDVPTGSAWITVAGGENQIIVVADANDRWDDIVVSPSAAAVVLCQLEIPLAVVSEVARTHSGVFILNSAPAQPLSDQMLARCDVLIVNEHELMETAYPGSAPSAVIDDRQVEDASTSLLDRGASAVLTTLGPRGARLVTSDGSIDCPAPTPKQVVDTTGAGDAFCGVFAARVAAGDTYAEAMRWGVAAGSHAVLKPTAQSSYPSAAELADAVCAIDMSEVTAS